MRKSEFVERMVEKFRCCIHCMLFIQHGVNVKLVPCGVRRQDILQQPFVKYVCTVLCQCETCSGWYKAHCAAGRYLASVCTTRIAGEAKQCETTIRKIFIRCETISETKSVVHAMTVII